MNSNVPIIKQTAWISLIPQLLFWGFLIFIYYLANSREPFFCGMISYLIIWLSLRLFVDRKHRHAIKLVKQHKFEEAISYFQKSYDFFLKNSWIDKYRYLTLLSSSKMCYREMALANIAFCYGQVGNGQKAIEYYKRTLDEFPNNGLAEAALKMINSVGK